MAISKDMIIADLIALDPNYAAILMASGMGCVGCPSSQGESIEQAAYVHGMDLDELLRKIKRIMLQNKRSIINRSNKKLKVKKDYIP